MSKTVTLSITKAQAELLQNIVGCMVTPASYRVKAEETSLPYPEAKIELIDSLYHEICTANSEADGPLMQLLSIVESGSTSINGNTRADLCKVIRERLAELDGYYLHPDVLGCNHVLGYSAESAEGSCSMVQADFTDLTYQETPDPAKAITLREFLRL